ncbi:Membrane protein involved in aromatic hydrocarbon degradation [Candidatus Magnetomorum sp. HK-1]|nr:Membrane protein involved in aromatic hydrocarbon degradation [Candidatus Magnetomorum sp. HK-1]
MRYYVKKLFKQTHVLIVLGLFSAAWAGPLERMEIPSSPNPVGSGARALGMGGAFIAVADDATAASWNPAGIAQLPKSEVSVVGKYIQRSEDKSLDNSLSDDLSENIRDFSLNYFSAAINIPSSFNNMVFSINYQQQYDFNREWHLKVKLDNSLGETTYDMIQEGELYALGLAYGVQMSPELYLGFTFNIWEDTLAENKWTQKHIQNANVQIGPNAGISRASKHETYSFGGYNFNLGLIWKATEELKCGVVIKTPFKANLDLNQSVRTSTIFPDFPAANQSYADDREHEYHLRMPLSYGIGVSYQLMDHRLALSADIYRTHWNQFEMELNDGRRVSPISGQDMNIADIDPTTWIRCGILYDIPLDNEMLLHLRSGIFYDPAPAERSPDDYWGLTLGSGLSTKEFRIDGAYQIRFGNDVGDSLLQGLNFSQDVIEHQMFISIVYYL